jgi:hypothetical protein
MRVTQNTKTTVKFSMDDIEKMVRAHLEEHGVTINGKCEIHVNYTSDAFDHIEITGITATCGETTKETTV